MMRESLRDDGLRTAAYWRERAEEAQGMAAGMVDLRAKSTLEDIADEYMLLAELIANGGSGHRAG